MCLANANDGVGGAFDGDGCAHLSGYSYAIFLVKRGRGGWKVQAVGSRCASAGDYACLKGRTATQRATQGVAASPGPLLIKTTPLTPLLLITPPQTIV